jgi:hypothetical protein
VIHIGNDFFQLDMSTCFRHLEDDPFLVNFHGLFHRFFLYVERPQSLSQVRLFALFAVGFLFVFPAQAVNPSIQLSPPVAGEFQWAQNLDSTQKFWEKPAIQQEMKDNRKIPVSVTVQSKNHWSFKGAGWIEAPLEFCLESAKDFDRLRKIPERFPKVEWNQELSQLSLEIHFLTQTRKMQIQLFESQVGPSSDPEASLRRQIYFRSLGPWLKGLEGVFFFKDLGRQATEFSLYAKYSGSIRWVPDFIFSFGAEAVMHHVALSLRNQVENDYKLKRP